MADARKSISVRQLPDGVPFPAELERCELPQMMISGAGETELKAGSLVEVKSQDTIYLGQVLGWREDCLLLDIEHFLSRSALADIHQAWSMRDGSH